MQNRMIYPNKIMKIYTKKGDTGTTTLINNTEVPKNHVRVEAYGTVDELNAHIGCLRDMLDDKKNKSILFEIQKTLFVVQTRLAIDPEKPCSILLPEMHAKSIQFLENAIDEMEELLGEFKAFLIPGGHPILSQCHIVRCVCRRTERRIISLHQKQAVNELILQYINRLSDFFFILSRFYTQKLNLKEDPWEE